MPARLVLGSGTSVTVLELHRQTCAATGVDIPAEHIDGPPGEMRSVVVDRSLADRLELGRPLGLAAGLAATWLAWPT